MKTLKPFAKILGSFSGGAAGPAPALPRFDTTGWTEKERSKTRIVWSNVLGDVLSLDVVTSALDRPPIPDVEALRRYGREIAEANGGAIVSVDAVTVGSIPAAQLIYKREALPAVIYTAILVVPFESVEYVIVAVFGEHGTTGIREAVVTCRLLAEGALDLESDDKPDAWGGRPLKGWLRDPYDPDYAGRVLCSLADDEKYDPKFPDHPLTLLRRELSKIRDTFVPGETSPPGARAR